MDGHSQQEVGPESLQSIMDMGADSSLEQLDMEQLKKDRFQRNQELMETLSKSVSREIFPQRCHENRYVQAAIMIQKLFRGHLGRKKYVELLYDQYAQEERDIAEKSEAQFVEGELLVENHQLEVLLDDEDTARRNRKRNYLSKVITIQRGWREYLKNKHSSDTDNSDFVEDVESKILHDESEKSQNLKKSDEKGDNSCDEPNYSAGIEFRDKDDKVDEGKDVNSISVSSSENIGPNIYKQGVKVNNLEINVASESAPLQESNDDLLLSVTKQSGEPTERSEVRTDSSHECAYVDVCESAVTSGSVLSDTDKNQVTLPSSLLVQHTEEPDAYSAACSVKAKGGNSKQLSVDLEKAVEKDLSERKSVFLKGDNSICPLPKEEGESEEEYQRRVRKHNFLTIARDFAELKKVNADVLPFDLHLVQSHMMDSCSDSSSAPPSHPSSELTTPITDTPGSLGSISQGSLGSLSHVTDRLDNLAVTDVNSNLPPNNAKNTDRGSHTTPRNISNDNDIPANFRSQNGTRHCQGVSSHGTTLRDLGEEGDFDVYNIETTAGANINWESLEKQLQQAEEEQRQRQESQRNDREEIRRKLAMETDEESFPPPSSVNSEGLYRRSQISSRLQGGMNLQICFMNEAPGDEPESPTESPRLDPQPQNTLLDKSEEFTFKPHELKMSAGFQRAMMPSKKDFEDEDFFKKQARLQHEAKIALAQASTMAHMQLEVEKQKKKKSPVADIIGHPLRSYGNKLKFNYRDLLDMNIAQLQVLVNELHSQIENLNEDLVKFLMERDELHMGQDSMLVDIEDLTRRMEDKAKRSKKGFVGRKS